MRIHAKEKVGEFHIKHPNLRKALTVWRKRIEKGKWKNRLELEQDFPSVDFNSLHDAYIFDIGPKYRLIAIILFPTENNPVGSVHILEIMHHDDYERWSNRK